MPNITVRVYQWQTEVPIPQAMVTVTGYPSVLTNTSGVATVPNITGDQSHTITTQKSGYLTDVRSPYISSQDYSTDVYLQLGTQPPPVDGTPPPIPLWKFGIVAVAVVGGTAAAIAVSKRKRR